MTALAMPYAMNDRRTIAPPNDRRYTAGYNNYDESWDDDTCCFIGPKNDPYIECGVPTCCQQNDPFNYNEGVVNYDDEYCDPMTGRLPDMRNWFFLNCILHPEDFEQHKQQAMRLRQQTKGGSQGGVGVNSGLSPEVVMQEMGKFVSMSIQTTMRQERCQATVEQVPLPSIAPGMQPNENMKGEIVLMYKVIVQGKDTPLAQDKAPCFGIFPCCQPHPIDQSAALAQEVRRASRTSPGALMTTLRMQQVIIKVDGADWQSQHGTLLGYGWPAEICDNLGHRYGFGAIHSNHITRGLQGIPQQGEQCRQCGSIFMPDAVFCRKCGIKRGMDTARTPLQALKGMNPAQTQAPADASFRERQLVESRYIEGDGTWADAVILKDRRDGTYEVRWDGDTTPFFRRSTDLRPKQQANLHQSVVNGSQYPPFPAPQSKPALSQEAWKGNPYSQ